LYWAQFPQWSRPEDTILHYTLQPILRYTLHPILPYTLQSISCEVKEVVDVTRWRPEDVANVGDHYWGRP